MLLLLTGCSAGTKKLRFGAAGLGGVYHIFADTFANVLSTENNDFQIDGGLWKHPCSQNSSKE